MLFSELPQKSDKLQTGPTWQSRAMTASLSRQRTGLAATWLITGKTEPPTDCQRGLWQQRDQRPGCLEAPNVNECWSPFSLCCIRPHLHWYDHIYLLWIILTVKTGMCTYTHNIWFVIWVKHSDRLLQDSGPHISSCPHHHPKPHMQSQNNITSTFNGLEREGNSCCMNRDHRQ